MNNRAQGEIIGGMATIVIVFILLDVFFLGLVLVDEPLWFQIAESLSQAG